MSGRPRAALAAFLLLLSCRDSLPAKSPEADRPRLYLLTPLPLAWSEGFAIEQPGSPALSAIEEAFQVTLVDVPSEVPAGATLLAAQPRAVPAEELVALDAWVRGGGRLLLLADPLLEWPSERPLGDIRRPPPAFADTGLLDHWGLRLDAPEERGLKQGTISGRAVLTASPGTLVRESGACRVRDAGLTARCPIGKGRAVVIADADWLNVGEDRADDGNLPALLAELAALRR